MHSPGIYSVEAVDKRTQSKNEILWNIIRGQWGLFVLLSLPSLGTLLFTIPLPSEKISKPTSTSCRALHVSLVQSLFGFVSFFMLGLMLPGGLHHVLGPWYPGLRTGRDYGPGIKKHLWWERWDWKTKRIFTPRGFTQRTFLSVQTWH